MIENLIEAIVTVLTWPTIGYLALGLIIGIVIGALPGVGGIVGMVVLLPVTIVMTGIDANILLVSIYSGAMYGACVSSILINVPGSGAAAATLLDGYPMTKQGKAMDALGISATSSALGGTITMILLLLLIPYISTVVLLFGTPHVFLVTILGIIMIAVVASQGSTLKGIASGIFGMLIMTIGIAPGRATTRYTFGNVSLYDGLSFIAIIIGGFAISEMIKLSHGKGSISDDDVEMGGTILNGMKTTLRNKWLVLKSALIGGFIGMIPGAGAGASNFFAYAEVVRSSEDTDFGEGNPKGVIGPEASNNATVAGALIPLLTFGIPGSASTAVLLGGLIMHGITPGSELFQENIHITYSLILALILGNILIFIIGTFIISKLGPKLTEINIHLIIPTVVVLSMLGAFTVRSNWIDIVTILIFGIIGYYMVVNNYSVIAMVLGAVLAPIAEENLLRSLVLSDGSLTIFISDILGIILVGMLVILLFGDYLKIIVGNVVRVKIN